MESASKAMERMASENNSLRKQVANLEKVKNELEQELQKKTIDGMSDLRSKEAKLKAKCKKLQREKQELIQGV